jgi:hypothetical protein
MPGRSVNSVYYPARVTRFGNASRQGAGSIGTEAKNNLLPGMAFF